MREAQALSVDPRAACAVSWSGGKDCNLALLRAWREPSLEVRALCVFRPPRAAFRAHPLALMEAQARALGLPLLHAVVDAEAHAGSYEAAYIAALEGLHREHGMAVVASGDMDLVGTMPRNWLTQCCEACSPPMRAFLPLWGADREGVLRELLDQGVEPVFSCVKSPFFDESWIGRKLDAAAVEEMKIKRSSGVGSGEAGLDLCGERGEYHTMVVDGPLYARPVDAASGRAVELVGEKGQPEGQRWWVLQLPLGPEGEALER